jgi:hypothetical protein
MKNFNTVKGIFDSQRLFGETVGQFGKDDEGRLELTKTLLLSLHNEVGQLTNSINFRHHIDDRFLNRNKMLFESVDVIRYVAAILNTWDFTHEDLEFAMELRDSHLNIRQRLLTKKWSGEPVVIVDMDDVIADFRTDFYDWLGKRGVKTNLSGKEYYNTQALLDAGLEPSRAFDEFINEGGMARLRPIDWLVNELRALSSRGVWVQILTARPQENPMVECSTFSWLQENGVPFDGVAFSPEKYRWLYGQDFYAKGHVLFAIDDSPKHALEYASHGVMTLSPRVPYNEQLEGVRNISMYGNSSEFRLIINSLEVK